MTSVCSTPTGRLRSVVVHVESSPAARVAADSIGAPLIVTVAPGIFVPDRVMLRSATSATGSSTDHESE